MLLLDEAQQIAAAFSLGNVRSLGAPGNRGENGQMYRLETDLGSFAVKEPFTAQSEADLAEGAAFQEAARRNGIPTPEIERTGTGALLLDLDDKQARVYSWVDLADRDTLLAPDEVGRLLAALHLVDFDGTAGEHYWYSTPVGSGRWQELIDALSTAGAPFAATLAHLEPEIVAGESIFSAPHTLRTCHRDLFSDNIRRQVTDGLCVFDFDDSGLADPSQELAVVLVEFGSGDADRLAQLYRSYVDAGGPGRVRTLGDFTMAVAQLEHITERACDRWLAFADDAAERSRMSALVGEYADRPLTLPAMQAILDAIR